MQINSISPITKIVYTIYYIKEKKKVSTYKRQQSDTLILDKDEKVTMYLQSKWRQSIISRMSKVFPSYYLTPQASPVLVTPAFTPKTALLTGKQEPPLALFFSSSAGSKSLLASGSTMGRAIAAVLMLARSYDGH